MSTVPSCDKRALQPGSAFAIFFILGAISVAALISHLPEPFWSASRSLTILVTKALGTLLGFSMTSEADILTVNGFAMRIINQCTAVDYLAILATAMLLYTRHSISYRILGVVLAVPIIILVNACRLIMSGVIGNFSRSAFDLVHDYLWVIGFAFIVFGVWTLWVNGRFSISKSTAWRVGQVTIASLAAYALLLTVHDAYGNLMARLSSAIYRLLNNDPLAAIVREGDVMLYTRAGIRLSLDNMLEQVNVAIFVGLMAPLQKKGDWEMLGMTVIGLLCIILTSAIFIALGCSKAVNSGTGGLMGFLSVGSVVHLALPMTFYWLMASEREQEKLAQLQTAVVPATSKPTNNKKQLPGK